MECPSISGAMVLFEEDTILVGSHFQDVKLVEKRLAPTPLVGSFEVG